MAKTHNPTHKMTWFHMPNVFCTAESDLELSKCIECGQCVSVCPVGALSERTSWREVLELLQSKRKVMLLVVIVTILPCC